MALTVMLLVPLLAAIALIAIPGDTRIERYIALGAAVVTAVLACIVVATGAEVDAIEATQLDLYAYAANNPVGLVDRTGALGGSPGQDERYIRAMMSLTPEQKSQRLQEMKRALDIQFVHAGAPKQKSASPHQMEVLASLPDLTAAQKRRIEEVVRGAHERIDALLTPAQRAQFKKLHGGAP